MWLGFLAFAHAVCGDGVVDADEQCDDFNLVAGDGCSQGCEAEPFWECASPAEPFVESFRWSAQSNCAAAPVADLAGIGVRVDLPEWTAFAVSPTGLDCVSAWSTGDAGRWFWNTTWQFGDYADGNGGSMSSGRYGLAACKVASETAVAVVRPEGERTVHFGMRDNPCYDNRGTVEIEIAAISDCSYVGDPDDDGLRNDVDDCPTVYLQLPDPFAANNACVSELASWTSATAGPWSKVHRDAVVNGVQIGRRAVIHRSATVGLDSVVMRRAQVGPSADLGAGAVLAVHASVGANVVGFGGEPPE
ncbi:MAG: cysteine-rich repeat protein [Myxococcota bacterium]|jgi:cysteine-rich repeat protein